MPLFSFRCLSLFISSLYAFRCRHYADAAIHAFLLPFSLLPPIFSMSFSCRFAAFHFFATPMMLFLMLLAYFDFAMILRYAAAAYVSPR